MPRRSPRHGYNRTQASSSLRPALQWERHGKESSDMDTASTIIQHSAQIGITWPRAARQVRVVRRKPPAADRSAPRWSKKLQSAYSAGLSQPTRAALDKFDRAGWSGRPRSAGHSPGWVTECAARGRHLGAPPCVKKTPEAGRQAALWPPSDRARRVPRLRGPRSVRQSGRYGSGAVGASDWRRRSLAISDSRAPIVSGVVKRPGARSLG